MERKYPQGTSFRCNSHQYQQIISCGACLNCVTSNNSKLYCTQSKTLTYGIWILAEIKKKSICLIAKRGSTFTSSRNAGQKDKQHFYIPTNYTFCIMLIVRKVSLYYKKLRDYCQRTSFFFFLLLVNVSFNHPIPSRQSPNPTFHPSWSFRVHYHYAFQTILLQVLTYLRKLEN